MRHTRLLIFKSKINLAMVAATLLWLLLGCASEPIASRSDKLVQKFSFQKIFFYSYDSVWRAAQLALKYPIAVNNMDNGILETDWVRGVDGFRPAHLSREASPGVRYKVQLSLVKGKAERRESVRVTIVKKIEKQRDFFSEPEPLETDGLEEKVLFYRMERELVIEEALKRAMKQTAN
ncbi:MAG: hypothetical protein ACK5P7_00795 [Bdellovibrio sp.]|jgi:hypothetical protein